MSFSSTNRAPAVGARAAKPAGTTNRLPGGRERRPALAALAVILILLGAAGSALIAINNGERQYYVAAKVPLPPGHLIDKDNDLTRGDLAGATGRLVPWSELERLDGQYTTSWIYPGQFLAEGSTTRDPVPEGGALVGISLEGGRAPSEELQQGDIVRLIRVPAANQDGGVPQIIAPAASIKSKSGALTDAKTNAGTTLNVTVLVPDERATAVAAAAAAKTLVLVKLSSAVKPEISNATGGR
ncbi:hypothetical protein Kfla_3290 [Kribbella flavida DSM 17836]|uniref:SAF domain protein n=1 Tax=Kribbella flavida (strain DSM 17836 / JCM 10339 / NBRC 14399) TaxID=479435 RepID=D2Q4N7_KRIFD|nr:hypothetical protein [Kribbella flavida]ADB32351.1 hypothetical protein Kfla_3290 [Kribbella flavida DSM 17836]